MRRPFVTALATLLAVVALGVAPQRAEAFGRSWVITEIYSNADGSVPLIELFSEFPAETLGTFLRSSGNAADFEFPTDLTGSTQDRHLLVATAAFAAQPGAVMGTLVVPEPGSAKLLGVALAALALCSRRAAARATGAQRAA